MSVAEALYRLQQRDLRVDALRRRQRDIEAATAEPASVLKARAAAAEARQRVDSLQADLRNAELERQSLDSKITSEERRLYSGKVTSVKEMTSIESEVQSLRKRLGTLDDRILETMMTLETAQAAQRATGDKLASIEQRWSAHLAGLREQQAAVNTELGEVTEQVAALRAGVAPRDLALYDELRPKRAGHAVAAIKSGRCEGCQVALPLASIDRARQGELAYCNNCGRILVAGV